MTDLGVHDDPIKAFTLTEMRRMVFVGNRGKHRGTGGDYVCSSWGKLVRLDDPTVTIATSSVDGDTETEADADLRAELLAKAEREEKALVTEK